MYVYNVLTCKWHQFSLDQLMRINILATLAIASHYSSTGTHIWYENDFNVAALAEREMIRPNASLQSADVVFIKNAKMEIIH